MIRRRPRVHPLHLLWIWLLTCASAAASDSVTLYGELRQTDDGGIVLHCPQEPGVVYLPFNPNIILRDLLNIQVQVRGEIRDSFQRDNTTMRILAVDSVKPMRAEYGDTTVLSRAAIGLPGTEPAEIHNYFNRACYLYDRYAVLTRQPTGYAGHALRVLVREPGDAPDAVCENLEGRPLYELDDPQAGFAGLSGDTLFIAIGQPQVPYTLVAINLARQQQMLNAQVVPDATVAGKTLRYHQQVNVACPQGKIAVRPMTLDLVTGRGKEIGKVGCWP